MNKSDRENWHARWIEFVRKNPHHSYVELAQSCGITTAGLVYVLKKKAPELYKQRRERE